MYKYVDNDSRLRNAAVIPVISGSWIGQQILNLSGSIFVKEIKKKFALEKQNHSYLNISTQIFDGY